jgi:hypothetical protein
MATTPAPKIECRLFLLWVAIITVLFFWSRLDLSHYIYYIGDGDAIVDLIRLMLASHVWDPNWTRLLDVVHPQKELLPFIEMPKPGESFYHMAGYMMMGAVLCQMLAMIGLGDVPIQMVLHVLNLVIQAGAVCLLYVIGKKSGNRLHGIFAATLFVLFPLAMLEAHYERPESWLCLLTTACLYCSLQFRTAPLRTSAIIGLLIGLSVATKASQLFLGLIPALLLLPLWLTPSDKTLVQRSIRVVTCGAALCFCLSLALAINTPFIPENLAATIAGVKHLATFYATPTYPYAQVQYHYFQQLYVSLRYFWFTLGSAWCFFFGAGLVAIAWQYRTASAVQKDYYLALSVPVLLFFFYSALQVNFIERNFSPWQGAICLISAQGMLWLWQWSKNALSRVIHVGICAVAVVALAYTPAKIDFIVLQHYIRHRDTPPRIAFQESLRSDFPGFWIKNVYPDFKGTGKAPEKPGKAPRIYQIDDINDHWTKSALQKLETQGFRQVAVYCSEFSDMSANSLTIYHAAAKNHYYVREDEWPDSVPKNYFRTNCP